MDHVEPIDVTNWLQQWTPRQRREVRALAALIRGTDARLDEAIKWHRLTFTAERNWHHWLCAVAVTRARVRLLFHKGALLEDPAGLLHGSGRYLREVRYEEAVDAPDALSALVREAIAHQRDMLA